MTGSLRDVVVIGAGPTGLFLAAELRRRGIEVELLDARSTLVPGSRAIGVHAPTLAALEESGATERILASAVRIPRGLALSGGHAIGEVRFDRLDTRYPFVAAVPQPATEAAVAHGGPEPRRGARVTALADRGERVDVIVDPSGSPSSLDSLSARIVVVCAGRAGRALVPGAGVREHAYPDRYLMADVPGPTAEPPDVAMVTIDAAGVLESFPLPGGGRRLVAWDRKDLPEDRRDADDDGSDETRRRDTERLRTAIVTRGAAPALAEAIEPATAFGIRRALPRRMRTGRVVAIGDTAHEVSPMGGQGMNLGLLDAAGLAPVIADWLRGQDVSGALARWERDRLASARTAARMAGLNTALGRPAPPVARALSGALLRGGLRMGSGRLLAHAYAMGFDRSSR